jgi:hypothetical protein
MPPELNSPAPGDDGAQKECGILESGISKGTNKLCGRSPNQGLFYFIVVDRKRLN